MQYIDGALMVLFALASIMVLARLLGRSPKALDDADPIPSPIWQQVAGFIGLLLLTTFAALRTFNVGSGQLHTSLGLLAVAMLLFIATRRKVPSTGGS